jgi:hypothetical protein
MEKVWKKLKKVIRPAIKTGLEKADSAGVKPASSSSGFGYEEYSYSLVEDQLIVTKMLGRIFQAVKARLEYLNVSGLSSNRAVLEKGMLPDERLYFFIQTFNESGFLVEERPKGWVISEADKIVHGNTFLRSQDAWDAVNIMAPSVPGKLMRISSMRFAPELLCYPVYEDFLLDALPPLSDYAAIADMPRDLDPKQSKERLF